MYPQKMINCISDEHRELFKTYIANCEYQSELKAKDKPLEIATIYHPTQVKKPNKYKQFETNGYVMYKIAEKLINTYISIGNFNPEYYKNKFQKSMLMNRVLEVIDKFPDNFFTIC